MIKVCFHVHYTVRERIRMEVPKIQNRNRVRQYIYRSDVVYLLCKVGPGIYFVFYTVRNNATAREDGYQSKGIYIQHTHTPTHDVLYALTLLLWRELPIYTTVIIIIIIRTVGRTTTIKMCYRLRFSKTLNATQWVCVCVRLETKCRRVKIYITFFCCIAFDLWSDDSVSITTSFENVVTRAPPRVRGVNNSDDIHIVFGLFNRTVKHRQNTLIFPWRDHIIFGYCRASLVATANIELYGWHVL